LRLHVVRIEATLWLIEAGVPADSRGLHVTVQATVFLAVEGTEIGEPPIVATGDVGRVLIFDFGSTVLLVTILREVDTVGVSTHNTSESNRAFHSNRR
jgi:hypothetical protein